MLKMKLISMKWAKELERKGIAKIELKPIVIGQARYRVVHRMLTQDCYVLIERVPQCV